MKTGGGVGLGMDPMDQHGPNIYEDTKPYTSAFLKIVPVKVLGGRSLSV